MAGFEPCRSGHFDAHAGYARRGTADVAIYSGLSLIRRANELSRDVGAEGALLRSLEANAGGFRCSPVANTCRETFACVPVPLVCAGGANLSRGRGRPR